MASQDYTNGVTLTDAAEFEIFDSVGYSVLSGVAGTNTITATGPATYTYAATRPPVWFIPAVTNTGATTINITPSGGSALTAKNIFRGGAACVGGELVAGVPVGIVYDGTQFNIIGTAPTTGTHGTTFTFNGSGGSTGSLSLYYQKVGRWVTLHIPTAQATSGTGSTVLSSDTVLPAALRPTATISCPLNAVWNNGAGGTTSGVIQVSSAGTISIFRDITASAYTNSTVCGTATAVTITILTDS